MYHKLITISLVLMLGTLAPWALAQVPDTEPGPTDRGQGVCQFLDEDGDGFNDLAPDFDGDGIPNALDDDYVEPEDGTGQQFSWGQMEDWEGWKPGGSVGDGAGNGHMNMFGTGDGTEGFGPHEDGGFGPGNDADPGDGDGPGDRRGGRV